MTITEATMSRAAHTLARDMGVPEPRPLGGGYDTAAWLSGDVVIRAARTSESAAQLRVEHLLLPRLAPRVDLAIPEPLRIAEFEDVTVLAHRSVPGEPLVDFASYSAAERAAAVTAVLRFLDQLHTFDVGEARACGVCETDACGRLRARTATIRSLVYPHLPEAARRWAEHVMEPPAYSESDVLIHGDIGPGHLFHDGNRIVGVIDFGDAAIGDPAHDSLFIAQDRWSGGAFEPHWPPGHRERVARYSAWDMLIWAADRLDEGHPELATNALDWLAKQLVVDT